MGNLLSLLTKLRCFFQTGSVSPQSLPAPPVEVLLSLLIVFVKKF